MDGTLFFVEFLNDNLSRIGNLLVIVQEDFLADNLCDKKSCRFVGQRILPEIGGMLRQKLHDAVHEVLDIEMFLGRCGEDFGVGEQLTPAVYDRVQFVLRLDKVYFVDHQQHGDRFLGHFGKIVGVLGGVFNNIGHIQKHIGIGQCAFRESKHAFLKFVFRVKYSGGIGEHDLVLVGVDDAHYAVACGLCFGCYDAYAFAYEVVGQCGFSYVGVAYDIDKSRFMVFSHSCLNFGYKNKTLIAP